MLLGSNLGNREAYIYKAIMLIKEKTGKVVKVSSIYESGPWGFESVDAFLNVAIILKTSKTPEMILNYCQNIENALGRKRTKKTYEARIIDIDILFYCDMIINTSTLTIPHKLIAEREFALKPLLEIAPKLMHPLLHKSIEQIYKECNNNLSQSKFYKKLAL